MQEIALTQGKFALMDDADYAWLSQWKWCFHSGGYAIRSVNHRHVYMHRLLLDTPQGFCTDHIDGNKLNNTRANLRICTTTQNAHNTNPYRKRRVGAQSAYKGVGWHTKSGKWRAFIVVDKKHIHLGCFDSERDAAIAYNKAAILHFGEFAKPNEIAA